MAGSQTSESTPRGHSIPDPTESLPYRWAGSLVERLQKHRPDRIAVESEQGAWSYGELEFISQRLAACLARFIGGGKSAVALYASREPSLVFALTGVLRAGLPFLILDPAYPPQRIARCISIARPGVLINLQPDRTLSGELAKALREAGCRQTLHWSEFSREHLQEHAAAEVDRPENWEAPLPEDLLYIAFTSGSTGFPKAILGTQGPVMHFFDWQQRQFDLAAGERVSVLSGLGHDPLLRDILMPLWVGATVCIPPQDCFQVPHRLFDWMRSSRITLAHLTPSLGSLLLAGHEKSAARLDALRHAFFGGETLKYPLVRRLKECAPNVTVVNCYGTTETPQVMGFHIIGNDEMNDAAREGPVNSIVPVGRGIDGAQLLVLDEGDRLCPPVWEGQIAVRSRYLAKEVRGEDGRLLESFKVNPYGTDRADVLYPTGDYGYYRDDGSVVCIGRRDKQIKIRGHRLQLEEIDHALKSARGVLQYHIDVEPSLAGDPLIVLYGVFDSGPGANEKELRAHLEARLPAFMLPGRIVSVKSLPLTPNGKVDVQQLRNRKPPGQATLDSVVSSSLTPLESQLLRLFVQQTSGAVASLDDELSTAGLDSLRAITACCAIEAAFGQTLSVQEVFDCRTIRGIAARLQTSPARGGAQDTGKAPTAVGGPQLSPNPASRLVPENERFLVGIKNRVLQLAARVAPDVWRVWLHRMRGVGIGEHVSIGYDTIVETSYPWLVQIGDHVNIGMRVTMIAHFRGMADREKGNCSITIQDYAFIGPGVFILPRVTIGCGAVITAASVVNTDIPPFVLAHGNPAKPIARCGASLSGKTSYDEFLRQLKPLAA